MADQRIGLFCNGEDRGLLGRRTNTWNIIGKHQSRHSIGRVHLDTCSIGPRGNAVRKTEVQDCVPECCLMTLIV